MGSSLTAVSYTLSSLGIEDNSSRTLGGEKGGGGGEGSKATGRTKEASSLYVSQKHWFLVSLQPLGHVEAFFCVMIWKSSVQWLRETILSSGY